MDSQATHLTVVREEEREGLSEIRAALDGLTWEQAFRLRGILEVLLDLITSKLKRDILDEESTKQTDFSDELLTAKQAAELLNVTPHWMYHHADGLPFTKRLSRKALRFSKKGLLAYRDSNKRSMGCRSVAGNRGYQR